MSSYTMTLIDFYKLGYSLDLSKYPIFNEDYREILNTKILQYFEHRELGLETPSLFKAKFELKLELIMPKYNLLYNAFNSITDILATRTENESITYNQESNNIDNVTDNSLNVGSKTPKNLLSVENLNNDFYADNASRNETNQTADSNNKVTSNTSRTVNVQEGNKGELLDSLKNTLYTVDELLLNELEELFMGVW